jgi:hypothetical protein
VPPGANAGIRETSAGDVVTLWCFTAALRECRDPWAAKLAPEIESSTAKASVRKWNLVSTTIAASIADSGMEYLLIRSGSELDAGPINDGQKTFWLAFGMSALPPNYTESGPALEYWDRYSVLTKGPSNGPLTQGGEYVGYG